MRYVIEAIEEYYSEILTNTLLFNVIEKFKIDHENILSTYGNFSVAGVDSSRTPPIRIGPYFFEAVSAASVLFPRGLNGEQQRNVYVYPVKAPEKSDYSYALAELHLNMFETEIEALSDSVNRLKDLDRSVIFLDGPIVDPPNFNPKDRQLKKRYEDYISNRIMYIARFLGKTRYVIGIVKRIVGNHFVSYLHNQNNNLKRVFDRSILNDFTYVNILFKGFMSEILADEDTDYILATKPIELSDEKTDYPVYFDKYKEIEGERNDSSLKVFYFYLLPGIKDPFKNVIGVEFALKYRGKDPSDERVIAIAWEISKIIYAWTLRGQPYPLPVLLAHKLCTIPKRTARKILKEITSRFIKKTLSEGTSFNVLMERMLKDIIK